MSSSEKRSTDSLFKRARRGSRSALNFFLAACRPWLLRYATARLDCREDASDLVQDCLLAVDASLGEFRGHTHSEFRKWMLGMLNNLIRRQHRFRGQQKRDRKREQSLAPGRP